MHEFRTHTCGELRKVDVGKEVRVSGWINSVRDHGGVIFIDLRDHYGKTQIVIDPKMDFYQELDRWRPETCLCFTGHVVAREESTINPKLATGEIYFGDWSQILVGNWGGLEVIVNPWRLTGGKVEVTVNLYADIAVRNPQGFVTTK